MKHTLFTICTLFNLKQLERFLNITEYIIFLITYELFFTLWTVMKKKKKSLVDYLMSTHFIFCYVIFKKCLSFIKIKSVQMVKSVCFIP
jgi:hypothetical protein